MTSESQLREKLRKIEALFAGTGTAGERLAAEAALQRVRARVEELARHDPPIEQQFSLSDQWSRHLFLALCRRCGLRPFRYHHQRRNTVMIRASGGFVGKVLLPEFTEERALQDRPRNLLEAMSLVSCSTARPSSIATSLSGQRPT
ncbi:MULTISPECIES: hypothetical protein [unclassified Bradyrhizobium]|uniref:hypothetical protein n=1 Tax=unclassified Bradyrhizobium TaxID=2631580 RepID=UPI0024786E0B|nr:MULTISPECIES: hypothetical protein [unclassified Bradyrhizobium]WGR72792.1 hypothetical protein MTX24_07760 [Bradyrhizobium sp. ISRA426]WGR77627.1 hypothetical protein MTX21_32715 [Bradyrhizobium sp. ISRA430]WGR88032.1 hypothetical protein MTX25_07765 [Bradyrhizobium sp. ISRA432]